MFSPDVFREQYPAEELEAVLYEKYGRKRF